MNIRTLRADEIECRVQQVKENGCVLLLYKDARCDMRILDEKFGINGWKREHRVMGTPVIVREKDKQGEEKEVVKGQYFSCIVSVWDDEKKEWISKEDTGNESNTDEIKGLYSDSFKRACVNLGIGRELYSAPFTWINLNSEEVNNRYGKYQLKPKVKFSVKEIAYDENRDIVKLVIVDQDGKTRFNYNNKNSYNNKANSSKAANNPLLEQIYDLAAKKGFSKETTNKSIEKRNIDINNFNNEAYEVMFKALSKLESKAIS